MERMTVRKVKNAAKAKEEKMIATKVISSVLDPYHFDSDPDPHP